MMKLVLLPVVAMLSLAWAQSSTFQVIYDAELSASSQTCESEGIADVSAVLEQFTSCTSPGTYTSCQDIIDKCGPVSSGTYQLQTSDGTTISRYCDMEGANCGGSGGWMRIAFINMTNLNYSCPLSLTEMTINGVRMCVYAASVDGCAQIDYGVDGIPYSQICGRLRGYQYGAPNGFGPYRNMAGGMVLSGHYVDGISITYGDLSPETHVWSFPVGQYESADNYFGCPCNIGNYGYIPAYVGDDYYCESGQHTNPNDYKIYETDPLYDGDGCGGLEGPCCTNYPNLPWFVKSFNITTTKNINTRYCMNGQGSEAITMDILELYVR